jgi:hypothetical protein
LISASDRILEVLRNTGPQSLDYLHIYFYNIKDPSLSRRPTLRGRLSEMLRDGQIQRDKNKKYYVATENE